MNEETTLYQMKTVGGYYPAAGRNTIRKFDPTKYGKIAPGDTVRMEYFSTLDTENLDDVKLAEESLIVSSVAMAPFNLLVWHHYENNHGGYDAGSDLADNLRSCYPGIKGDDMCLAIYFV